MGQARHAPERPERRTNRLGLHLRARSVPRMGKGAALVMPRCNTEAMNLHLAEIATQIAPGAHAALLVDQAGWHLSGKLIVPPNITLIPLPANARSSTRRKRMAIHARRTGSRTGSSNPSTTSSTTAAMPGTSSPISPGGSCRSAYAIGPMGPNQELLGIIHTNSISA